MKQLPPPDVLKTHVAVGHVARALHTAAPRPKKPNEVKASENLSQCGFGSCTHHGRMGWINIMHAIREHYELISITVSGPFPTKSDAMTALLSNASEQGEQWHSRGDGNFECAHFTRVADMIPMSKYGTAVAASDNLPQNTTPTTGSAVHARKVSAGLAKGRVPVLDVLQCHAVAHIYCFNDTFWFETASNHTHDVVPGKAIVTAVPLGAGAYTSAISIHLTLCNRCLTLCNRCLTPHPPPHRHTYRLLLSPHPYPPLTHTTPPPSNVQNL